MELREVVEILEKAGELLRIRREVNPRYELAAVVSAVQKGGNQAVLFEKVKGHRIPVLSNVMGSYRRIGIFLECKENQVIKTLNQRWGLKKTKTLQRDVISRHIKDKNLNLLKDLPIVTHYEKDVGPYITGGIVLSKNPETKKINLSYHRMQLSKEKELRMRITPGHHLGQFVEAQESRKKNLEIAVLIGSSPAVMLAACSRVPLEWDELELAGALQGKSIRTIKCSKVDLEVPEDTEIVIEGEIIANVRKVEGPYGDWLGNYVPATPNHVFRPLGVSFRENPFYYTILSGSPEDIVLLGLPVATTVFREISRIIPSVIDVACWPFLFHCIIQLEEKKEGQAKQAILSALGADMEWIKYCIAVDPDVNIYDPKEVFWALATRCCPERDIFTLPGIPSFARDPHHMHWGRVGIDATVPFGLIDEFERKRIPGEDRVQIKKYIKFSREK